VPAQGEVDVAVEPERGLDHLHGDRRSRGRVELLGQHFRKTNQTDELLDPPGLLVVGVEAERGGYPSRSLKAPKSEH
jgi:hypothetical protein